MAKKKKKKSQKNVAAKKNTPQKQQAKKQNEKPIGKPKEKVNYYEYIASKEWQRKRLARIKLDGYKCHICGSSRNLNVHHLTYERLGHEDMEDLMTLCRSCHEKVHEIEPR